VVRIIASKQELIEEYATLRDQLAALSMPVTDEEWCGPWDGSKIGDLFEHEGDHTRGCLRATIDDLIASRLASRKPAGEAMSTTRVVSDEKEM
jgi:hypothetical protein